MARRMRSRRWRAAIPTSRCLQRIGRRGLVLRLHRGHFGQRRAVLCGDGCRSPARRNESCRRCWPRPSPATTSWSATRYAEGGSAGEGFSPTRAAGSQLATRLSTRLTGVELVRSDERLLPDAPRRIRGSRADALRRRLQDPARHHRDDDALPQGQRAGAHTSARCRTSSASGTPAPRR